MANATAMKLVLEDGTEMVGRAFVDPRPVAGEVVFNTGMTGYVETLTDPSYKGQILVTTYPLVGNYGVPAPREAGTLERPYESDRIQVQGLVVQTYVDHYSHHRAARSLAQWLSSEGVPAVTGIDTRTLTRRLRHAGTMQGWLFPAEMGLDQAKSTARGVEMHDEVFRAVSPAQPIRYPGGELKILLVDAGAKDNIVRSLLERGASAIRAPYHSRLAELALGADGVLIGNGPGEPERPRLPDRTDADSSRELPASHYGRLPR